MYGLSTAKGFMKRGVRAYGPAALAALIFFSALSSPVAAQTGGSGGGTGKVQMRDIILYSASAGLARGQTLRVSGVNALLMDGSVKFVKMSLNVFDGATGALLRNHEVDNPPAGLHSFDINRDDIALAGEPETGRVQLVIGVQIILHTTGGGRDEEPGAGVSPPMLELVDNGSGRTVMGLLLPAVQVAREAARR